MGHRFSDMDSVGSSAGLCQGLRLLGIDAFVAVDRQTTLSAPLIEQIGAAGFESLFVDAAAARDLVDDETLVVVMDTHAKPMVEVPELLERCKSVVVIDHHRKRVDYIENAVIFYHEPYSSSASEMVAELLQYLGDGEKEVEAVFAEALLAGLVLDTKNFAVKTGVKTFEAAGYLRSLGADTVEVKRLFSSTMEDFQNRTAIVTGAHVYKSCAIAKSPDDIPDIRVVSAQAADELLEISDVRASFVLFSQGSQVNISARSLGQLNVQLILESLGGGGHHTMAGAQLRETSLDTAVKMLEKSIDLYYEQNHIQ
nr:DHH family phosphoesterase [Bittarella massiliensis (ex Durand et al. 2017)]